MLLTDTVRMLLGASVLAFAAVCDLRWRRAPDALWLTLALAGALLLFADAQATDAFWATHQAALLTAGVVLVLAVVGYLTGLIAGGADAKALASLAILAPLPLGAAWSMPLASPLPFVVTSVTNALFVALVVPLVLFVSNLLRGHVDGLRTVVGFRVPLHRVDARVVWPLEYLDEEGEHAKALTPGGVPLDAFDATAMEEHGIEHVWVTPKVPFLVPLWCGFVIAMTVGDPFVAVLDALLA